LAHPPSVRVQQNGTYRINFVDEDDISELDLINEQARDATGITWFNLIRVPEV